MARELKKTTNVNPQIAARDIVRNHTRIEINKNIDLALKTALDAADSHEARVEILLLQIVRNTKP